MLKEKNYLQDLPPLKILRVITLACPHICLWEEKVYLSGLSPCMSGVAWCKMACFHETSPHLGG